MRANHKQSVSVEELQLSARDLPEFGSITESVRRREENPIHLEAVKDPVHPYYSGQAQTKIVPASTLDFERKLMRP